MGNSAAGSARSAYSGRVPLGPDPERARAALEQLDALRATVTSAEDDVLACLVVTGEPRPQRVLDDWLDQVADTLRALGEEAAALSPTIARYAVAPGAPARTGAPGPADRAGTGRRRSTAGGRPVSVVPGDPASLSACAARGTLGRRAARWARDGRAHGIRAAG